jgi:hypothetical protein
VEKIWRVAGNKQSRTAEKEWSSSLETELGANTSSPQNTKPRTWTDLLDWIDLAQDREKWRALVNVVMSLLVPQNSGNFLISWGFVNFSGTPLLHGVSYS